MNVTLHSNLYLCQFFKILTKCNLQLTSDIRLHSQTRYPIRTYRYSVRHARPHCKVRRNFFLNRYCSLWNQLPETNRVSPTESVLKTRLKEFITIPNLIALLNPQLSYDHIFENGLPDC